MNSLLSLLEALDCAYKPPIEEDNTTTNLDGGEGQPQTPYVFSKGIKDRDDVVYSEPVQDTDMFYKKIEDIYNRTDSRIKYLTEARYADYVNDNTQTDRQKINNHVLEINRKLREVEQMISHTSKFKTESGATQEVFWKKTVGSFVKIKERLNRLTNKIIEMES